MIILDIHHWWVKPADEFPAWHPDMMEPYGTLGPGPTTVTQWNHRPGPLEDPVLGHFPPAMGKRRTQHPAARCIVLSCWLGKRWWNIWEKIACFHSSNKHVLVGGFNHLEKYEFVNGKDDIPYMKWKIKNDWNHQPVVSCQFKLNWLSWHKAG